MRRRGPLVYRLLLRLLPAAFRRRAGHEELELAFIACMERERRRRGRIGVVWAWLRGVVDVLTAAALMWVDVRRSRQVAALSQLDTPHGDTLMRTLVQDTRHAIRTLRRAPLFSAVVIATLGLSIGVNTAISSIVDAVLLRALPYRGPDRLAVAYEAIGQSGPIGFSAPDFKAFESRVTSFEAIAAFTGRQYQLSGIDRPERVAGARVSAAVFEVLGVAPSPGRTFSREDDDGRRPVVVLSDRLWRRHFAADAAVIGRSISLDRRSHTVVAIMPPGFVFPNRGPLLNNVPGRSLRADQLQRP